VDSLTGEMYITNLDGVLISLKTLK